MAVPGSHHGLVVPLSGILSAGVLFLLLAPAAMASAVSSPGLHVVATCTETRSPEYLAYDPADKELYLPNLYDGNVSIVSAPCDFASSNIDLGNPSLLLPTAAAYDPQNHTIYVTDDVANEQVPGVWGIRGSHLVSEWSDSGYGLNEPSGILYDPMLGANRYPTSPGGMVVADTSNNTLSEVSTTHGYLGNVALTIRQAAVTYLAYDAGANTLAVMGLNVDNVTILNGTTLAVVAVVPVGESPAGAAYDPADHDFYVANIDSDNVSVLNGSTGSLVGTISSSAFSEPRTLAYSAKAKAVFLVNAVNKKIGQTTFIFELKGTKISAKIMTGGDAVVGLAYDGSNDDLYETSWDIPADDYSPGVVAIGS